MSYCDLEIWKLSREAVIAIHEMTLISLPKFEAYEEGSQIRRSSKTTKSTIVEGYGRRRYKADWIHYLTIAHASNSETVDHLEYVWETGSLRDEALYRRLHALLDELGAKLNRFIAGVERSHRSEK